MQNINKTRHPRLGGGQLGGLQYAPLHDLDDDDVVLLTRGPTLPNAQAAIDVYLLDPGCDRHWFRRHRRAKYRLRAVTQAEVDALDVPPEATVRVWMTAHGLARQYLTPPQNNSPLVRERAV